MTACQTAPGVVPPSASVHSIESTVEPIPRSPVSSDILDLPYDRTWAARHDLILAAMVNADASLSRIAAFDRCGDRFWLLQSNTDPDTYRAVPNFCHDRFCEPCAIARSRTIATNVARLLPDRPLRLLTLTIRSTPDPLATCIDRLLKSFRRLRSRVFWKDRVTGGASFLEFTRNLATGYWHPHLHILLDSVFIPVAALRDQWLQVTGDSYVLDISLIRSKRQATAYIAKYATKCLTPDLVANPEVLVEVIKDLSGRKLVQAFGAWSRWKLLSRDTDTGWHLFASDTEIWISRSVTPELRDFLAALIRQATIERQPVTGVFPGDPLLQPP